MRIAQLPFIFAAAIPFTHAWTSLDLSSRRVFVTGATATVAAATAVLLTQPVEAAVKDELLEDLRSSKERMAAIPALLDEKEWDKVRTILKLPPVNKLWNLGDVRHDVASVASTTVMLWLTTFFNSFFIAKSQNVVLQLAKETGNIDLFELKEELSYNLQMCDQLTYNNAFVYFQPGSGKFNINEPKQLAIAAMRQIQEAIDLSNE
jgi:hypothetical protein